MGLRNQSFDDRDTDHLRYSNNWFLQGEWNASDDGPGNTGTLASSNDFTASVTFTFTEPANAFYYYGMKRSGGGLYHICIDCDPNAPNPIPIDALDPSDDGGHFPSLLFSHNFDDFGVHEIILSNTNDTRRNPAGTSQITVDRFEIQVQDDSSPVASPTPSATSTTSSSTSTPPSSSSSTTASASSLSTTTSLSFISSNISSTTSSLSQSPTLSFSSATISTSSSTSPSPHRSTPVAAIVGGTVGGLFLILISALIFFCIRRQKNSMRQLKAGTDTASFSASNPPSTFLSPYNASRTYGLKVPRPQSGHFPNVTVVSADGKQRYTPIPTPPTSSTSGAGLTSSTDVPLASISTSNSNHAGYAGLGGSSSSGSESRRPRREVDAGRIMESAESEYDGSELETLPPDYDQVFRSGRHSTRGTAGP